MLFGYLTLATALIISLSAAVYSILGLTAIFAAAFWPIVIMGGSLEVGKIVTTLWLHKYWNRAELQYKLYLCSAVAVLMFLTSMGVFGFLSKAHSDQALVSGDVGAKIAVYDEKIKTARDNIEADRKQLSQMDAAVDQVMARSTTEGGADKSNAIRNSQKRDRAALAKDIEANQKIISQLNDEAAPIRAEVRKVEADVGPIKYIAALIYGDNPDANLLEHAVRWVIILIVAVFDPLALTLLLAATKTFEWEHDTDLFNVNKKKEEKDVVLVDSQPEELDGDPPVFEETEIPFDVQPELEEDLTKYNDFFNGSKSLQEVETKTAIALEPDPLPKVETDPSTPGWMFTNTYQPQPKQVVVIHEEPDELAKLAKAVYLAQNPDLDAQAIHEAHAAGHIDQLPWHDSDHIESLPISDGERARLKKQYSLQADNMPLVLGTITGFGTSFPTAPNRGDLFLRVDALPTVLYKYNGQQWIEVDKRSTDTYAHDEAYIDHLIDQIGSGQYDPDLLSDAEREQIALKLKRTL